ncbi:hypothetical protein EU527_09600 [Candidatus Thorarchaeota archaeon]|nr:MAG: hypothetical protein EU527_09600 [Candidatus Thorarchaeota archaeon]
MSETLIVKSSSIPYQIAIFILLQIWALMCYEISQYQLVVLYESPFTWFGWITFLLIVLLPILVLLVWKFKDRIQITTPNWKFRIREINENEYEVMVKEYNRQYRDIISSLDYLSFLITIILYFGILFLPFLLMRTNSVIISLTPFIVALMVMLFGLLAGIVVFKAIPTSVAKEFPVQNHKKHRKMVHYLISLPGISWSGIRLIIGEDRGFYTLRNPIPIARIEGIEGVAWIECVEDSDGTSSVIRSQIQNDASKDFVIVGEITLPTKSTAIVELIKRTILLYIDNNGVDEFLEDVLEDIDAFLLMQKSVSNEKV